MEANEAAEAVAATEAITTNKTEENLLTGDYNNKNDNNITNNDGGDDDQSIKFSLFQKWENLRKTEALHIEPRRDGQLLDVLRLPANGSSNTTGDDAGDSSSSSVVAFCNIVGLYPFTNGNRENENEEAGINYLISSFIFALATELAIYHLNEGIGSLVNRVEGLNERCNIKFTSKYIDTEYQQGPAMSKVMKEVNKRGDSLEEGDRLPSGFLGAQRSAVSGPTSSVTGLMGYPQLSGASTSAALDDKTTFPKFGRTIPSDDAVTYFIVEYFRDVLKLDYIALINVNDSYGNNFVNGLVSSAKEIHPKLKVLQIPVERDISSIEQAISTLKESKYLAVFCILLEKEWYDDLMMEAYKQGVAGTSSSRSDDSESSIDSQHQNTYNWLFADSFNKVLYDREFDKDSVLYSVYKGAGMIAADAKVVDKFDLFERTLQSLKPPTPGIIDSIYNNNNTSGDDDKLLLWDYFGTKIPYFNSVLNSDDDKFGELFLTSVDVYTAFFYDAAILMGLAACDAVVENSDSNDLYLNGDAFFDSIKDYPNGVIDGVTGDLLIDPITGSRNKTSIFYTMTNYGTEAERYDAKTGKIMVSMKPTTSYRYMNDQWELLDPYIFNDGTTTLPIQGIPVPTVERNTISVGVRAISLLNCIIAIVLPIGFGLWTYLFRRTRVVRASQPFFLYLICIGCFIMATTIITFQLDEQNCVDDDYIDDIDDDDNKYKGCTIACNAVIWQGFIGFAIIFSSIYAKTRRINRILRKSKQCSRIVVTVSDTVRPVLAITSLNVLVLSLMSALHPLAYKITIVKEDAFGQVEESYGHCSASNGNNSTKWYVIVLAVLDLCTVVLSIIEGWKARNLATEFAESQYIFLMLITIMIVICMGGPILYIAKENPSALLFVSSGFVFVSVCSVLLFMYVPKIYLQHKRSKKKKKKSYRQTFSKFSGAVFSTNKVEHTRDSQIESPEGLTGELSFKKPSTATVGPSSTCPSLEGLTEELSFKKPSTATIGPSSTCPSSTPTTKIKSKRTKSVWSRISLKINADNDNDNDEDEFGEKVFSNKSRYELVRENKLLKGLLEKEKKTDHRLGNTILFVDSKDTGMRGMDYVKSSSFHAEGASHAIAEESPVPFSF